MKSLALLAGAAVIALPALALAQSTQAPVTRAEVRADLISVEKAGYNPGRNSATYPADIQAAEAKVAAQEGEPAAKPETRAEVRKDLLAVEKAGYDPFRVSNSYPTDIEAAEAKVAGTVTKAATAQPAAKTAATAIPRIDLPRNAFYDGA